MILYKLVTTYVRVLRDFKTLTILNYMCFNVVICYLGICLSVSFKTTYMAFTITVQCFLICRINGLGPLSYLVKVSGNTLLWKLTLLCISIVVMEENNCPARAEYVNDEPNTELTVKQLHYCDKLCSYCCEESQGLISVAQSHVHIGGEVILFGGE